MVAMLTASQARTKARIDSVIHAEIRDIETEILTAVEAGLLSVEVDGNSVMTWSTQIDGLGTASNLNPAVPYNNLFKITAISVAAAGTGYTSAPTVTIAAPDGETATNTTSISGGALSNIVPATYGSGYDSVTAPIVTMTNAVGDTTGAGASVIATTDTIGRVIGYALTGAGSNYTLPPVATVASPNVQATATVTVSGGGIDTFTVTAVGGGYVTIPTVTIAGGGATNATKYLLAQDYYKTWQNLITDKVKLDQMAQVSKHFKDLAYSITQKVNSTTTITFKWVIEW
jgi:hypothetical protein